MDESIIDLARFFLLLMGLIGLVFLILGVVFIIKGPGSPWEASDMGFLFDDRHETFLKSYEAKHGRLSRKQRIEFYEAVERGKRRCK